MPDDLEDEESEEEEEELQRPLLSLCDASNARFLC